MENLTVKYNEHTDILSVSWTGKTTVDDIAEIMVGVIKSGVITTKCKRIFSDQREVEYIGNLHDFRTLFAVYKEYHEWFDKLKLSVVINSPILTAVFMLFSLQTYQYKIKAFYSENEAKSWLLKK